MWCRSTWVMPRCPEAVTRYFLDHYVTVCERFNFSTAESDYQECGAFHTAQRNQAWYAAWNKTNPQLPAQSLQGRHDDPRAGDLGQLLHPGRWRHGSCPGALLQGASARRAVRKRRARTGSRASATPMRRPRATRRCGAGIRSASRSSTFARSPRSAGRRRRRRPQPRPHGERETSGGAP